MKMKITPLTLRGKIILLVCGIITIVLGVNTYLNIITLRDHILDSQRLRAQALAQAIIQDVTRLGATMPITDMAGLLARHCYQLHQLNQKDGITSISVLQGNGSVIAHSDPLVQFNSPLSSEAVKKALGGVSVKTVIEEHVFHTLIPIGERDTAIVDIAWNRTNFDSAVRNILKYSALLFVLSVLAASLSCGYLLNKVFSQLEDIRIKLETLSITDSLTKLANRRHFDEVLSIEYGRHVRSGGELSLIMLDIDYFKAFNDNYGHITGDNCLRQVGRVLADCALRPADLAARYGGEEFACILPETDRTGAITIAEQIRRSIQTLAIPHIGSSVADHVTASLGVVTVECTKGGAAKDIISQADDLLYRAKSSGRNRIEIAVGSVAHASGEVFSGNFLQLAWKDFFCSGNPLIDAQHQSLFHVSNRLLDAILSGSSSPDISVIIGQLLADVTQHFHDEQMILEDAGFPGMQQHIEEHAKLLCKGLDLSKQFHNETLSAGDVFQFLAYDVVMIHMLGADREYFPYILEKNLA
jgi:diguanylate cyclase (GGDEF)-like protein/hemerythrin-like metal-binding protein